ncbi:MAG: hypothetical protein NVSMB32_03700 [Actinomycetota bacterium]
MPPLINDPAARTTVSAAFQALGKAYEAGDPSGLAAIEDGPELHRDQAVLSLAQRRGQRGLSFQWSVTSTTVLAGAAAPPAFLATATIQKKGQAAQSWLVLFERDHCPGEPGNSSPWPLRSPAPSCPPSRPCSLGWARRHQGSLAATGTGAAQILATYLSVGLNDGTALATAVADGHSTSDYIATAAPAHRALLAAGGEETATVVPGPLAPVVFGLADGSALAFVDIDHRRCVVAPAAGSLGQTKATYEANPFLPVGSYRQITEARDDVYLVAIPKAAAADHRLKVLGSTSHW